MAKAKREKTLGEADVIEGVVRHKPCGWTSSGKPFREGAFCPRCGEPITRKTAEEVTEGELVDEPVEDDDDDEEEDDDAAEEEEEEEEDDEDLDDDEEDDDEDEDLEEEKK